MFQRLRNILGTIFGIFVSKAEDAVPLEERLKYDRQRKSQTLKQQMDRATPTQSTGLSDGGYNRAGRYASRAAARRHGGIALT